MDADSRVGSKPPVSWATGIMLTCQYSWTRFGASAVAAGCVITLVWLVYRNSQHHEWVVMALCGLFVLLLEYWSVLRHELADPREVQLRNNTLVVRWRHRELLLDPSNVTVTPGHQRVLKGMDYIKIQGAGTQFRVYSNISNYHVLQDALRELGGKRPGDTPPQQPGPTGLTAGSMGDGGDDDGQQVSPSHLVAQGMQSRTQGSNDVAKVRAN